MTIRAKFTVNQVSKTTNGSQVFLTPVISGSEENRDFWKYTPSGKIEITITNTDAANQFEPGDEFYVDFTKVEK